MMIDIISNIKEKGEYWKEKQKMNRRKTETVHIRWRSDKSSRKGRDTRDGHQKIEKDKNDHPKSCKRPEINASISRMTGNIIPNLPPF